MEAAEAVVVVVVVVVAVVAVVEWHLRQLLQLLQQHQLVVWAAAAVAVAVECKTSNVRLTGLR